MLPRSAPYRDYYLWSALVFSLASHAIAFLQFSIRFSDLGLPARWHEQFALLVSASAACAVLSSSSCIAARSPGGSFSSFGRWCSSWPPIHGQLGDRAHHSAVRARLRVDDLLLDSRGAVHLRRARRRVAPRGGSPVLGIQPAASVSMDNLLFMGFYPLVVMALGAFLKNAQRLAAERKRLVEQLRQAGQEPCGNEHPAPGARDSKRGTGKAPGAGAPLPRAARHDRLYPDEHHRHDEGVHGARQERFPGG